MTYLPAEDSALVAWYRDITCIASSDTETHVHSLTGLETNLFSGLVWLWCPILVGGGKSDTKSWLLYPRDPGMGILGMLYRGMCISVCNILEQQCGYWPPDDFH